MHLIFDLCRRVDNRISGHHAPSTTVAARIYACIDTHRTSANAQTKVILCYANQVNLRSIILKQFILISSYGEYIGEFVVTSRPPESPDYHDLNDLGEDGENSDNDDKSSQARIVIIATAILGGLLIIVVAAILCKFIY